MDYQALIREEIEYQRRRLYRRLKTSEGGRLIVEYWTGSKNFLNSVQGISWEKKGNKILIKEKAVDMKTFRDIILIEKKARTGTTTQKDRTGHIHSVMLDDDGSGKTIGTKGGKDHVHKVREYSVQPADGHTHKLADGLNEGEDADLTYVMSQFSNDENSSDKEMIAHLLDQTDLSLNQVKKLVSKVRGQFLSGAAIPKDKGIAMLKKYL